MNIETNPSKDHLKQVKSWLRREEIDTGHSFICNWDIIADRYSKSKFICALQEDLPIAFFTWCGLGRVANDLIAVVKPEFRGKGIGSQFMDSVETYLFDKRGVLAMCGECKPESSESFWRGRGYVDFPAEHTINQKGGIQIYKSLMCNNGNTASSGPIANIQLWNRDIGDVQDRDQADVHLSVPLDKSLRPAVPVVLPAHGDWKVAVAIGDHKPVFGKVKYVIPGQHREIDFLTLMDFAFINTLSKVP